jgi:hypothetical protein
LNRPLKFLCDPDWTLPINVFLGFRPVLTYAGLEFPLTVSLLKTVRPMKICYSLFPCFLSVEWVALPGFLWCTV